MCIRGDNIQKQRFRLVLASGKPGTAAAAPASRFFILLNFRAAAIRAGYFCWFAKDVFNCKIF